MFAIVELYKVAQEKEFQPYLQESD